MRWNTVVLCTCLQARPAQLQIRHVPAPCCMSVSGIGYTTVVVLVGEFDSRYQPAAEWPPRGWRAVVQDVPQLGVPVPPSGHLLSAACRARWTAGRLQRRMASRVCTAPACMSRDLMRAYRPRWQVNCCVPAPRNRMRLAQCWHVGQCWARPRAFGYRPSFSYCSRVRNVMCCLIYANQ